jgi:hypothetical protein
MLDDVSASIVLSEGRYGGRPSQADPTDAQDDLVEIAALMTIDEGAEPEVLAGMRQLLNATSSPVIVKWSEL